jgi:hypothetical protein
MISLAPSACAPGLGVDAGKAIPVPMGGEVHQAFSATSDCMYQGDGKPTLYALFRLPERSEPYLLSVRSVRVGMGLAIPRLYLMNANSVVLREVDGESFSFHGSSMLTKLRSHPGEAYLAVAVDTRYVGQQVSRISSYFSQSSSTNVIGHALVTTTYGNAGETQDNYVFSFNGIIDVGTEAVPNS